MAQVLHLTGPVLVRPQDARPQAWVVGGRITYAAPGGDHDVTTVPGWVLPGLVDAHSHIGLGPHGAVDAATAEGQALADRDAGALLLRDAGSPADTRWVQARDDLPRLVRAGRHIAAPGGTSETSPGRSSRTSSSSRCGSRPAPVTGGSSWSVTGSTATPVTSRRAGPPTCSPTPSWRPTRKGLGSRRTASARSRCATSPRPAPTASSTPAASSPTPSPPSPPRGSPSFRPWSTSTPSRRSPSRPARSSPTTTGT